ncbi:DUF4179 domain-containing protein [Anaeromicropila herbilytica]|uniref:DUF4179 domain-containing protein n=1 Tax=Anaeromicropila herbilytica TaxID=2785025 RepID=A0A7R7EHP1_9FIRM|nr:DUF4179 domain-containing protein [Anaeromicropila herbilytica]BCN28918.1 hypothetical protein bsdtb5_02130 [Anaeromicropila herbilytica]
MDNDRMEEYQDSLSEIKDYPFELNQMVKHLNQRIECKRRKRFLTSLSSMVAVFLLFVITVNSNTTFAEELFKLPVIGTLAEYVQFDKGLQNAVKNKYVKKVNLIAKSNGYTLSLPYAIADTKQLVVFFQVPEHLKKKESDFINVDITKIVDTTSGKEYKDYISETSYPTGNSVDKNLYYTSIRSGDYPIPENLKIYVTMRRESQSQDTNSINNDSKASNAKDTFETTPNTKNEKLGEFVYALHMGKYPEPIITTLNKDIKVNGQTIHINSVGQYPTGTEININIPDNNDYIINGLDFKVIDNSGKSWGNPGGVTAIGPDEKGNTQYFFESDYFHSNTLNKIKFAGIRMLKKSEAVITLDLKNKTMAPELKDIQLKNIERSGNKAYITFSSDTIGCLGLFQHEYKDTKGNQFEFHSESGTSMQNSTMENYLATVWPKDNKVILTRCLSPMIKLKKPVEITLEK